MTLEMVRPVTDRMLVLVVEDDARTRRMLVGHLASRGFVPVEASQLDTAVSMVEDVRPDVVLLDLTISQGPGLELLQSIRESSPQSAVIVISRDSSEEAQVRGLTLGADDYVVKPYSFAELEARITAVTRRWPRSAEPEAPQAGELLVDLRSREAFRNGEPLDLTPREFDLIAFLVSHPRQVFTRDQLLRSVWGSASEWQSPATVTEHIRRLRLKIEAEPTSPRLLRTVRRVGYRLDP